MTVEAHAFKEALALAKALHVNKVSIAADSVRVVKEFQSSIDLARSLLLPPVFFYSAYRNLSKVKLRKV